MLLKQQNSILIQCVLNSNEKWNSRTIELLDLDCAFVYKINKYNVLSTMSDKWKSAIAVIGSQGAHLSLQFEITVW